ncbi:ubiquitin-protein ligase Anaphase Promoting Complex [Elasticomyces elasticus]|nr:ubiquitin-protein ligase Anaphase Promoting Complex [Elasticomyces elasticus]
MKVTIKAYRAVASWRWDMPDDDLCGICRVEFDGTCPKCKFPGDECPLMFKIKGAGQESRMEVE